MVMDEKREQEKNTNAAEKSTKSKAKSRRSPKKEYTVVLVKPTVLIVSINGSNTRVSKIGKLEDLKAGDKVRL